MRIISWNIQHGGGKRVPGITRCLERWDPDIAVLGEVRGTAPSGHIAGFLADTGLMNQLHTVDHAQATRNSLLIASRFSLAPRDRAGEIPDPHRWLAVDVHADQPFTLIGMHVPNRSSGKKFDFHDAVVRELGLLRDEMGLAIRDTNTGRIGIDEPTRFFQAREDQWFDRLDESGWEDVYRKRFPLKRVSTWHSQTGGGFRLDQAFATAGMDERIKSIRCDWGEPERPSDHAAIVVEVE